MKQLLIIVVVAIVILIGVALYFYFNQNSSDTNQTQTANQTFIDDSYQLTDIVTAKALIDYAENLVIVDVSELYDQGHIAGAINIPLTDLESRISQLEITKPHLVYCHSLAAAKQAAQILIDNQVESVYVLEGNYQGWVDSGGITEI